MYRKSWQNWFKHIDFVVIDVAAIQISFVLAYLVKNGRGTPYQDPLYFGMAMFLVLASIVVSLFYGTYKNILKRGFLMELRASLFHGIFLELLCSFYLVASKQGNSFSRAVLYLLGIFYFVVGSALRSAWKQYVRHRLRHGQGRSLLIVTLNEYAEACAENVKKQSYEMFHIVGMVVLDQNREGEMFSGVPVVATGDDVVDFVCRRWVDEVLIEAPDKDPAIEPLIDAFAEMGVVVHIKLFNRSERVAGRKQFVEKLGDYTVLTSSINSVTPGWLLLKRLMDIAGGILGCLITGILYCIVAPAIRRESPGSVFFVQERVGRNGKKFRMYKFRTMYPDAEERKKALMEQNRVKDGMMFKMDFDPRIIGNKILPDGTKKTGIGAWMRRLSIDEFPQFVNVLKGDMSLVGTRPPTLDEWEKYELHHRARMAFKPGITGMWQVSGRSNITDFEEIVRLDTQYISEWSLALDIKILFKTIAVLLKHEGAM